MCCPRHVIKFYLILFPVIPEKNNCIRVQAKGRAISGWILIKWPPMKDVYK